MNFQVNMYSCGARYLHKELHETNERATSFVPQPCLAFVCLKFTHALSPPYPNCSKWWTLPMLNRWKCRGLNCFGLNQIHLHYFFRLSCYFCIRELFYPVRVLVSKFSLDRQNQLRNPSLMTLCVCVCDNQGSLFQVVQNSCARTLSVLPLIVDVFTCQIQPICVLRQYLLHWII